MKYLFFILSISCLFDTYAQGTLFQGQPDISAKRSKKVKIIKADPARKQKRINTTFSVTAFSNEMHVSNQLKRERMAVKAITPQYNPTKENAIPDRKEVSYQYEELPVANEAKRKTKKSRIKRRPHRRKLPSDWK